MSLARGLLVLAIVAALWGAPSSVSAAVNELSSPQVSPGSGSVTTLFTFRVRYEGGFPAAAVGVTVAGLTLPMVLESGSTTAGWWAGSTLLPGGAWSTSFRATAARGPSATAAGPVVIVAGLAPPSPTSSAAPPSSGATPQSASAEGLEGPTAPPAAPAPSRGEAAAIPAAVATAAPGLPGPTEPGGSGGSGGSDAPSKGGSGATPAPGGGGGGGGASAGQGAPAASPASSPAPGGLAFVQPASDTEPRDDSASTEEIVSDVLLVGVAGVASVAIIGMLLLIAGRRREPARATARLAPTVADDARTMRRVARVGRAQPGDDPIVAALGIDDEMAARRAIRRAGRATEDGRPGTVPKRR